MKALEQKIQKGGISVVDSIIRFGTPFERVIEYSEELDVNLIVLGSGNQSHRNTLGGVAEKVMTYAAQPVWIVKRGTLPRIRNILCPVDFSESSRRALRNAILLSKRFHARLTVQTVFEPLLSHYFGKGSTPGESKEKFTVRRQQQEFDRFLRGFRLEEVSYKKLIRRGKPGDEILRTAHEVRADLLIMGSSGKTGLTRMLLGSTTEKVVRALPCSSIVLIQEHVFRIPIEQEVNYMRTHFQKGLELAREQRLEEAIAQFEHCLRKDSFFIPAWEEMAVAFRQMGQGKEAQRCEEMAAYIRKHLWENHGEEHAQETS
jgi:nucleotide-binding universal stress UspA family protein